MAPLRLAARAVPAPAAEEAFALTGSSDKSTDIEELNGCMHRFLRLAHLSKLEEPFVGNLGRTDVRILRCKGVRRSKRAASRQGIEERRFSRVGQTYESKTFHGRSGYRAMLHQTAGGASGAGMRP